MKHFASLIAAAVLCLAASGQGVPQTQPPLAPVTGTTVPRLVNFSGTLKDSSGKPLTGPLSITFSLFAEQEGGTALWSETQMIEADAQGHYSVFLGATNPQGLPLDIFATGAARWLAVEPGVPAAVEPARILLVGVPYALKAADADTLGGKPASAFVTTQSQSEQASSASAGTAPLVALPAVTPATAPTGSGATDYIPLWTSSTNLGNSILFQNGSVVEVNGTLELPSLGTATSSTGYDSEPFDLFASVYNSSVSEAVPQHFRWEAEPVSNDTSTASGKLDLLYASGTATPAETGLSISSKGILTFAPGQTLPAVTGNETVSGNVSASQLISTAATGLAPLQVSSTTQVSNLNASLLGGLSSSAFATHGANTFNGNQLVNGTGAAGNYGLTVNQPTQSGILVEAPGVGAGAGINLQTTGGGFSKGWQILATGYAASQGLGKLNIRDLNTSTDVLTVGDGDIVNVRNLTVTGSINGALTLQGNITDGNTGWTSSNVIGGYTGNAVTNGATGATIAGGGLGNEFSNTVSADFGTVSGGFANTASSYASTAAGGSENTATGYYSTVPGGQGNTAGGYAAFVAGGAHNSAGGELSFAAGYGANASDNFSFVWCQQNGAPYCKSNGTNSFTVSVDGPIYFYDDNSGAGHGCYLSTGAGSWTCSSDRNLKDNIRPIDSRSLLERVAQMPISQWSIKTDTAGHNHIGPMAQDFYAAFGLGDSDKYIAQGDAQGVALAGIQALYQMVREKDEQLQKLVQEKTNEIEALRKQLQALEERTYECHR